MKKLLPLILFLFCYQVKAFAASYGEIITTADKLVVEKSKKDFLYLAEEFKVDVHYSEFGTCIKKGLFSDTKISAKTFDKYEHKVKFKILEDSEQVKVIFYSNSRDSFSNDWKCSFDESKLIESVKNAIPEPLKEIVIKARQHEAKKAKRAALKDVSNLAEIIPTLERCVQVSPAYKSQANKMIPLFNKEFRAKLGDKFDEEFYKKKYSFNKLMLSQIGKYDMMVTCSATIDRLQAAIDLHNSKS